MIENYLTWLDCPCCGARRKLQANTLAVWLLVYDWQEETFNLMKQEYHNGSTQTLK